MAVEHLLLSGHSDAATKIQKQDRKKMTKSLTNTSSKYCKDNTKKLAYKVYTYYTKSIQLTVA
jgi:hypothetical protein